MDLSVLDDYLFLDGAVSEIDISDARTSVASRRLTSRVEKLIGNEPLSAYYYEDVNSDLTAIMNGDKGSSIIVLVFLFIIAAAGISNTMIMAAMERRRERDDALSRLFEEKHYSPVRDGRCSYGGCRLSYRHDSGLDRTLSALPVRYRHIGTCQRQHGLRLPGSSCSQGGALSPVLHFDSSSCTRLLRTFGIFSCP